MTEGIIQQMFRKYYSEENGKGQLMTIEELEQELIERIKHDYNYTIHTVSMTQDELNITRDIIEKLIGDNEE